MISPQKENGYTSIANELMEALAKYPIPGAQMQCLLYILRKTYGFNKKADKISLSQFVRATGLPKRTVIRAIDQLMQKNLIYSKKGGVKNDTVLTSEYRFNKHHRSWKTGVKIDTGGVKRGKNPVSNLTHTKEIIQKKYIPPYNPPKGDTQKTVFRVVDYLNRKTNSSYKPGTKTTVSHIKARLNEGFEPEDFKVVIDHCCKKWGSDPEMQDYLRPQTLFNSKFESYLNAAKRKLSGSKPKTKEQILREHGIGVEA